MRAARRVVELGRAARSSAGVKTRAPLGKVIILFVFSSRRRHTRLQGDWSSDVCSSDLLRRRLQPLMPGAAYLNVTPLGTMVGGQQRAWQFGATMFMAFGALALLIAAIGLYRSEERRVGKEGRSRWSPYP